MPAKSILRRYHDEFLRHEAGQIKGVVLDIGCGNINYSGYFNQAKYYTLDLSKESNPSIVADAYALGFAEKIFDAVLLANVLEHLENPEKALKEIRRVLKPGGKLLVSVPFLRPIHNNPIDVRRFTPKGLEFILKGFEIEKIENLGGYFSVLLSVADDFANLVLGRRLSGALCVLGKFLDNIHLQPSEKRSEHAIGNAYALGFFAVCRKRGR